MQAITIYIFLNISMLFHHKPISDRNSELSLCNIPAIRKYNILRNRDNDLTWQLRPDSHSQNPPSSIFRHFSLQVFLQSCLVDTKLVGKIIRGQNQWQYSLNICNYSILSLIDPPQWESTWVQTRRIIFFLFQILQFVPEMLPRTAWTTTGNTSLSTHYC